MPHFLTNQFEVTKKGSETRAPVVSVKPSSILGAFKSIKYQKRKLSIKPHKVPKTKMTTKRIQTGGDRNSFRRFLNIFFGGADTSMSRMTVMTNVRKTKKLKK